MEDHHSDRPFTPAGVVADASGLLAGAGRDAVGGPDPEELVGAVEELEALRCRLAAVETTVLAEIDARKVPKTQLAWGSTAEWFTHLAGTHRSTGHRTVRQAGQLVGERPAHPRRAARGAGSRPSRRR